MENKSHAFVAGLFSILFVIGIAAAVYWFGGKKEPTEEYLVVTQKNTGGLNPQAQVRYRGIRVGKVKSVGLDRQDIRNILIRVEIDASIPITRGTTAKLGYQGVTGLAHVLLEDPGTDPTPLPAGPQGEPPRIAMGPSLMDELTESGKALLQQAQTFMANANSLVDNQNRERLTRTLANLEASTAELTRLLADERLQKVGPAIASFHNAADEAKALFGEARSVLPKVKSLAEKADGLVGDQGGEGAAAAMARLNELARELTATSRQVNRLLGTLEQTPSSVIFGRPAARPGPGEPGFTAPGGKK